MILAARSWGDQTAPAALLLHGAGDSLATWSRVGPWLAERGWNAIAMDLRGHGDSASPVGGSAEVRSLSAFADDCVETLRVLRRGSAALDVAIGHSLGALVAVTYAEEHACLVRRLVLEGPLELGVGDVLALADDVRARIAAAASDPVAYARAWCPDADAGLAPEVRRGIVAAVAAADARFVPAAVAGLADADLAGLVRRCVHPQLVLPPCDGHALHRAAPLEHAGLLGRWLGAPVGDELVGSHASAGHR